MEYDVGQVLYAVSNSEMRVVPLRVTERIVRQTLDGEIITYVAQLPDGRVLTDLSKLGSDVHISIDDVREKMISSVTEVVDKIIDSARDTAASNFGVRESTAEDHEVQNPEDKTTEDKSKITLPDGTVANITLPNGL